MARRKVGNMCAIYCDNAEFLAVDFVCDHPSIRAISFVGSDRVGQYIYERGTGNGKRVQSNMGAKNHGVILPDANKEHTINQVCARIVAVLLIFSLSL